MNPLSTLRANLRVFFERTLNEWLRYMEGIFKNNPVGSLRI